ncbi:LysR family transcriptional regulator [Pelagibacterium sp. H642]|uniref:LysR family transcriptional regulator n=1 Tax=Pelagibacterium sp. H642 TaxID=1881069 RepID=UPI002816767C|nr:LysR family transcriptional regulator [Pelagibacterium sp. H642]WMT91954.1 LysR family transcriptional regulator [Pelagibacterium sp. H642]
MDRLAQIEAFIRVSEEGSFSAAARSLKTTQPSVSKAVADLEKKLGTRLLNRTTRTLSLTEAGIAYYRQMKRIVLLLDEANAEVQDGSEGLRGRIRVNAPGLLASNLALPALLAFQKQFSEVTFDLIMEDRRIDPVGEAADVTVRIGALADSTLRARRAGAASIGLYAAPEYLARRLEIASQAGDTAGLGLLRYSGQKEGPLLTAVLQDTAGYSYSLEWSRTVTVSNGLLAREAALQGAGVAIIPRFLAAEDVKTGRLAELLADTQLPALEISLLHPFTRDPPHRVKRFMDFAVELWRTSGVIDA